MVAEIRFEHASERAGAESVAPKLGIGTAQTVPNWVRRAEIDAGKRPGAHSETAEERRQHRAEKRELRTVY